MELYGREAERAAVAALLLGAGVLGLLAEAASALVLVDDLQWADAASAAALGFAAPARHDGPAVAGRRASRVTSKSGSDALKSSARGADHKRAPRSRR